MTEHQMFIESFNRPRNFFKLTPQQQWDIDKDLGILDWMAINLTEEEEKRFKEHYN